MLFRSEEVLITARSETVLLSIMDSAAGAGMTPMPISELVVDAFELQPVININATKNDTKYTFFNLSPSFIF